MHQCRTAGLGVISEHGWHVGIHPMRQFVFGFGLVNRGVSRGIENPARFELGHALFEFGQMADIDIGSGPGNHRLARQLKCLKKRVAQLPCSAEQQYRFSRHSAGQPIGDKHRWSHC